MTRIRTLSTSRAPALAPWLALLLFWLAGVAHAAFIVGIPPIHNMRTLAARYEPLRAYLETQLAQPVRLESAPDFIAYHERTLHGDFNLTLTPAHFARLAEKNHRFQPVVQFTPDHDALLIYHARRPLSPIGRLKGEQLAVIDRHAITVIATLHYLQEQGLTADKDFRVVEYRNHASVAQALINGQAIAGVSASHSLKQMPPPLLTQLRVHTHTRDVPAFVMLLKPDAPAHESLRLKSMLLAFPHTPDGQEFLQGVGYSGLVAANETRLRRVDPYLGENLKAFTR